MNIRYNTIDSGLFIENRKRFAAMLTKKSVAIINSNDEMPRSADQNFVFRQNSDLFYLTGIDQEDTALFLFPDAPTPEQREILFIRRTNEHIAVWDGHKYTKEEARAQSGIQTIFWYDEFYTAIASLMLAADTIYYNSNENPRYASEVHYRDLRLLADMRSRYPLHKYERAAPLLTNLREVKSQSEVAVMQQAIDITEKAFRRVLGFIKPGVAEYEIEAEIIHEFIRNRAQGHAYTPIIASGKNACVLHYIANNGPCADGELILMDFGSEYGNYISDLTRCVPVNGKFSPRQKDVYNAVLRVMKQATAMLVVGNTFTEYNKAVGAIMEQELIGLGLLKADEVAKQDPAAPLYKKYFMHGTSHFLGIDVHDVGDYNAPFRAGNCFSCEPGIYIPEEGLGIRIENNILITDNGPVDLMANIPIEVEEIEALMAQ
jgi:Xaa-Pro aminopeptidase